MQIGFYYYGMQLNANLTSLHSFFFFGGGGWIFTNISIISIISNISIEKDFFFL